jgi:hypothetical protein
MKNGIGTRAMVTRSQSPGQSARPLAAKYRRIRQSSKGLRAAALGDGTASAWYSLEGTIKVTLYWHVQVHIANDM